MSALLADTLMILGYRPEDDSWDAQGRQTLIHDDNADRGFLLTLANALAPQGWRRHPTDLRAFLHEASGEIIEIEVGGSNTTGQYLHHLSAKVANEWLAL